MNLTEQQLAELRVKHPRGLVIRELSDGSQWVFRKPTADEWRACKGEVQVAILQGDAAVTATAQERLAQACCLHPGANAFQALRDEDPAIAGSFGEILFGAVGTGRKILEGKAGP